MLSARSPSSAAIAAFVILLGVTAGPIWTTALAQQPPFPAPPAAPKQPAGGSAELVREFWDSLPSGSLRDLIFWLVDHAAKVLVIVAVVIAILWFARLLEGRIVALLAGGDRGDHAERQKRAKTLVSVLNNALRTTAIAVGVIMVLEALSIPIGPLLGSVAVVGLAVAFGAQSLIKDYFTGFLVLLEQQYVIGDEVKIAGIVGQVERITLRLTILRDLEGCVHFIPHGQIATVSNFTHDWSQAVLDIAIAKDEDVDRVIELLMETARELRSDPVFSSMVLDDPAMLGVETLGETFIVKFCVKTLPTKRWDVKRELLRRIKRRFDELGIKAPFTRPKSEI